MQRIAVSVLMLFIGFPAIASRLPVVNVGAGSVSARAAFGEGTVSRAPVAAAQNAVAVAPVAKETVTTTTPKKNVVARLSTTPNVEKRVAPSAKDTGGDIVARADVLSPRRPSSDLWAKNETPLRMPTPQEFSVIRSDYDLPEESLDAPAVRVADVTPRMPVAPVQKPMSELDAQIERLTELQRRADESVSAPRIASRAAAPAAVPVAAPAAKVDVVRDEPAPTPTPAPTVSLRRMVVPMDDDVIVRAVEKSASPQIASVRDDMTKLSPSELRRAFRKTYLSENKHLSTFQIDDRFDVASDMTASIEGFSAKRDLSEGSGIRPLEIKIKFRGDDSSLSRENYTLLTEYAGIVVSNPKRAIQVSIPVAATQSSDGRKLAARRLAIVEQVLRDTGVSEQRIMPVLSQRNEDGMVLRIISSDQYETLTQQKRDIFGDTVNKKTYKSMSW